MQKLDNKPLREQLSNADLLFLLEVFERSGNSLNYRAKLYRQEAIRRGVIPKGVTDDKVL